MQQDAAATLVGMEREFIGLNIAVIAVSEVESSGDATKVVADRLGEAGHVVKAAAIDDSVQLIRARLLEHIADPGVDVVIVLAGLRSESAGIALDPLITRGLDGFSDLLRMIAYHEIGSAAMLVDAEAALCKSTFVFVLPASISQVRLALDKLLLPQLDYRTKPRNLVMQIARIAHVDAGEEAAVVAPVKDSNTAPMPWITPRPPGEPSVVSALPSRPTPPAVRKSMSMSVAEAMPSPSASMSAVLSKVSAAVSVSQQLPVVNPFETREPTNVGAPPAPPPLPRGKVSATISAPLPIKPPAKLIPLAALLPVPEPAPIVVAPPAEPERKMVSLADLDDDGDELDELDEGVAEIVDEPPKPDAPVVAKADDLPPPRRAEESVPPLYDDSPRRIAEPRQPRRRDGKGLALLLLGLMLVAATTVLVIVILQKKDREARAGTPDRGELVATRDPAPPPADPRPPIETQPTEAQAPPTEVVPVEPKEIEMPPADPTPAKEPVAVQPKTPKAPRPPRLPQEDAVRDPADVLATAPVNKVEDGCDEVSCILDKYKQACCARFKPAEVEPPPEKPVSGLPEKLDKLMVQEGISAVKPAVIACGERVAARGTVKIQVKVSPSGKVLSTGVASSPDPELGACVAGAVKLAKFPETDEGGSFGYPFVF
jgi:molybdenum cofactor biosynthesis protein B